MSAKALRRLAWRLLLPIEQPVGSAVLLGADDRLLDAAEESGMATRVTSELQPADLIAVLSGARADPRAVADALAPGGVVWWEVDRRDTGSHLRTPGRLRRQLRRAGLDVGRAFAVRPSAARNQVYLSLDDPGALRWYRRHAEITLRWRAVSHLRSLLPAYAITAAHADTVAHTDAPPAALITNSGNRAVLVALDGDRPDTVTKVPLHSRAIAGTGKELTVTEAIVSAVPDHVAAGVPRPLGLVSVHGVPSLHQEMVSGGVVAGRCTAHNLELVTAWLAGLHAHPVEAGGTWDEGRHERVRAALADYASRYGSTTEETTLFANTLARSERLVGTPVPIVWEHGDLTPWNVVLDGARVAVLDWEGARPGLPGVDLLRFVTLWRVLAKQRPSDADATVRRVIDRYCAELSLPREFEQIIGVLVWVEVAIRRDEHRREFEPEECGQRDGVNAITRLGHLAEMELA